MNIVVFGNGGREFSLIKKLHASQKNLNVYCFGDDINHYLLSLVKGFNVLKGKTLEEIVVDVQKLNPRFVVIGPEKYLKMKIPDELLKKSIPSIGPLNLLANIELSKLFTCPINIPEFQKILSNLRSSFALFIFGFSINNCTSLILPFP